MRREGRRGSACQWNLFLFAWHGSLSRAWPFLFHNWLRVWLKLREMSPSDPHSKFTKAWICFHYQLKMISSRLCSDLFDHFFDMYSYQIYCFKREASHDMESIAGSICSQEQDFLIFSLWKVFKGCSFGVNGLEIILHMLRFFSQYTLTSSAISYWTRHRLTWNARVKLAFGLV